jgi:hypothetical protein
MLMSIQMESLMYQRLQHSDSFRLLHLERSELGDTWNGTIVEDRLSRYCNATNGPKYVALSYVWGDPTFDVPNKDSAEINISLSDALAHILCRVSSNGIVDIWIDQTSVNQYDGEERRQQINLMGRIFAEAAEVIGWLGPAFEGSDEAMDDLIMFAGSVEKGSSEDRQFQHVVQSRFGEHSSLVDAISYFGQVVLLGTDLRNRMRLLFNLPWFQRRWIAQEACLASNLRVHCGHRSVSGDQLFRAINVVQTMIVPAAQSWLQKPFRNAFILLQMRNQVQKSLKGGSGLSFPQVIQAFSHLDCREDKDRVNALLGIVPSSASWFTPRYCPAPKLYVDFAIGHMQHFRSLDIIRYAGIMEPLEHRFVVDADKTRFRIFRPAEDLPSWVPDWRVQHHSLPLISTGRDALDRMQSSPAFEASLDQSTMTLTLRGKLLKPSIEPSSVPYIDTFQPKEEAEYQYYVNPWWNFMFLNYLGAVDPSLKKLYHTSPSFIHWLESATSAGKATQDLVLRYARTLIMDGRTRSTERPDCMVPRDQILEYFMEYATLNLAVDQQIRNAAFAAMFDDRPSMEKAAKYGYLAEHSCRYRTMFAGDKGFIGLGSSGICPGDRVAFFSGLDNPFILHPKGENFELRGECYLDGFMDVPYDELEARELDIVLV